MREADTSNEQSRHNEYFLRLYSAACFMNPEIYHKAVERQFEMRQSMKNVILRVAFDELFAEVGFPGWEMEHAALTETSLMQFFNPDLVRDDRIVDDQGERMPTYAIFPAPDDIIPKSGVYYKAASASQEKGEKLAKHLVGAIVQICHQELEP